MKILILLALIYTSALGQNPSCSDCADYEFPYQFCDPNQTGNPYETTVECTNDPYQYLADNPGLNIVKANGPICFEYDSKSFPWFEDEPSPEEGDVRRMYNLIKSYEH